MLLLLMLRLKAPKKWSQALSGRNPHGAEHDEEEYGAHWDGVEVESHGKGMKNISLGRFWMPFLLKLAP